MLVMFGVAHLSENGPSGATDENDYQYHAAPSPRAAVACGLMRFPAAGCLCALRPRVHHAAIRGETLYSCLSPIESGQWPVTVSQWLEELPPTYHRVSGVKWCQGFSVCGLTVSYLLLSTASALCIGFDTP